MTFQAGLDLILGNLGTLVLLSILLVAIVNQRFLVPAPYYRALQDRAKLLEAENKELNSTVKELAETITGLRVELARLQSEVGYMRQEVTVLQRRDK